MNNILSNYNLQLLRSIIFAIEKRPNVFIECFLFLGFKFKIKSNGYTYKFMINLDIISYEKQKEHRIIFLIIFWSLKMKNEMRIKKQLEDFHKTVRVLLFSRKSQILKYQPLLVTSVIGKATSLVPKIQYIKEVCSKQTSNYLLNIPISLLK